MADFAIEQTKAIVGGLITNLPSHIISRAGSPDAQNFDPSIEGGLSKRAGFVKFSTVNASATGTYITGLFAGTQNNGTTNVFASEGTKLWKVSTSTSWTECGNAAGSPLTLTSNEPVDMTIMDNVYIFCLVAGPFRWDGTTTAGAGPYPALVDLGTDAPNQAIVAGATLVEAHKNRTWVSGRSADPSKVYWSAMSDPTTWIADATSPNAGHDAVFKDDGMTINGLKSNGDVLFVSKLSPGNTEGCIYGFFGDDPFSSVIRRVSHFGAVSQRAMLAFDGVMIVADTRGIHSLSAKGVALLSRDVQDLYEAIPNKHTIVATRYKNQIWFAYDSTGNSINDSVLVLDINRGRWSRYTGNGNISRAAVHPNGALLTGSMSGSQVINSQMVGTNDDGAAIDFYWSTPDLDWGSFYRDKAGKLLFVLTEDTGNFNITMTRFLDGEEQSDSVPYTFNVQVAGDITTSTARLVLPSSDRNSRFIRFKLRNNAANEPITIKAFAALAELEEETR